MEGYLSGIDDVVGDVCRDFFNRNDSLEPNCCPFFAGRRRGFYLFVVVPHNEK